MIARPKIVTMDNKKAIIRQGEKYPYVVRDDDGQLSTELKDIELVLEVTPRIAFDGSVNMEISVKRNAIGSIVNSLGDPSIASREAQTEVLVWKWRNLRHRRDHRRGRAHKCPACPLPGKTACGRFSLQRKNSG